MPVDISLPPVVGDPAGMRALAALVRNDATMAALVAADASSMIDGLEFYGPAADRIEARVRSSSRQGGEAAELLMSTAALLERAATEVEAQQRARLRQLEQLRLDLGRRPAP